MFILVLVPAGNMTTHEFPDNYTISTVKQKLIEAGIEANRLYTGITELNDDSILAELHTDAIPRITTFPEPNAPIPVVSSGAPPISQKLNAAGKEFITIATKLLGTSTAIDPDLSAKINNSLSDIVDFMNTVPVAATGGGYSRRRQRKRGRRSYRR